MLPLISRRVIYPLHERFRGRRTLARLREMEREQWLSPNELRELAAKKLRALLIHASRHVAFYCDRLVEESITPATEDPHAVLRTLPVMSKSDIRRRHEQLTWRDAPGGLHPYATGGSSGDPLQFFLDRRRQGSDQAARALTHRWFGVDLGERELWVWGSPIEATHADRLKVVRDRLLNQRLLSAFDMSEATMQAHAHVLRRFQPAAIFGYPSTLARWAEHLLRRPAGLGFERAPRAVFVTGEVCDRRQREILLHCFGAPVADGYGSREGGFIAHECPEGSMHVISSEVLVEILDGETPLNAGEFGEIVITHLEAYGMPFIRYRTGDTGRLLPGRCACGRSYPRMDRVQGRRTDFVHLPDGTFMHGLSVIYVLRETPGVVEFQATQRADYSLDIAVVTTDAQRQRVCAAIRDGLRRVMRGQAEVRVHAVEAIPTAVSGKHRPVISLVEDASARAKAVDCPIPQTGVQPAAHGSTRVGAGLGGSC